VLKEKIVERLDYLSEPRLHEVLDFVEFLTWKTVDYATPWPSEPLIDEEDPLIGLFSGSSDLAEQSEEILQQEITKRSGWTWKELHL